MFGIKSLLFGHRRSCIVVVQYVLPFSPGNLDQVVERGQERAKGRPADSFLSQGRERERKKSQDFARPSSRQTEDTQLSVSDTQLSWSEAIHVAYNHCESLGKTSNLLQPIVSFRPLQVFSTSTHLTSDGQLKQPPPSRRSQPVRVSKP